MTLLCLRSSCPATRTVLSGALLAVLLPWSGLLAAPTAAYAVVPTSTAVTAAAVTAAAITSTALSTRTPTTLRLSAAPTEADGRSRIGVRVLDLAGAPISGVAVAVDGLSGSGAWVYLGQVSTDATGLGVTRLPFSRDTRVRAVFTGDATREIGRSPERVVSFVRYAPAVSLAAVAPASTLGEQAVALAAQQQGKPYRWGSAGPSSFDCSGLVTYVYRTRLGRDLPRTSSGQAQATQRVPQSAKAPGDLILFPTNGRIGHVGIYAGNGKMWAAPSRGGAVQLQTIYTSNYLVGRVA